MPTTLEGVTLDQYLTLKARYGGVVRDMGKVLAENEKLKLGTQRLAVEKEQMASAAAVQRTVIQQQLDAVNEQSNQYLEENQMLRNKLHAAGIDPDRG